LGKSTAASTVGTNAYIPARVPQHTVADFSADYWIVTQLRLLGGISNPTDKKYFDRVFSNGIEPGLPRSYYAGFSYEF
jgi:Fe(3+) dicitrate transport protein